LERRKHFSVEKEPRRPPKEGRKEKWGGGKEPQKKVCWLEKRSYQKIKTKKGKKGHAWGMRKGGGEPLKTVRMQIAKRYFAGRGRYVDGAKSCSHNPGGEKLRNMGGLMRGESFKRGGRITLWIIPPTC